MITPGITPGIALQFRDRGQILSPSADYSHHRLREIAIMMTKHYGAIEMLDAEIRELIMSPQTSRRRYLSPDEIFPPNSMFWDEDNDSVGQVAERAVGQRVAGRPNFYFVLVDKPRLYLKVGESIRPDTFFCVEDGTTTPVSQSALGTIVGRPNFYFVQP